MRKQFENKVAVVTGAGGGIGRQLAIQLAEQGCNLALADLSEVGLKETRSLLESVPVKVTTHIVDVADRAQVEASAEAIAAEHISVNYLFNNAGAALACRIDAASYEDMHWLMNINFWGVVHGCKAFLPLLKQQDMAHIVNVSSVFGLFTAPFNGAYSASKFAVNAFTDTLGQELKDTNVNVSCAFPAGIKTDIAKNARMVADEASEVSVSDIQRRVEAKFWTTPEQAATEILKGVVRNKRRILVGKGSGVMDRIVRLFPVLYPHFIKL